MESCVEAGKFKAAIQIAESLISDEPEDMAKRRTTGVWHSEYWPHCLKAKALIGLHEKQLALDELRLTSCPDKDDLLSAAQQLSDWRPPQGPQSDIYALVIGVDRYDVNDEDSGIAPTTEQEALDEFERWALADLSGAVNDATSVFQYLLREAQIPRENLRFLAQTETADGAPTNSRAVAGLEWIAKQTGHQVIFYFAGHGMKSRRSENLMLIQDSRPWEWRRQDDGLTPVESTSLSIQQVVDALIAARFEERVMLIDACRDTPSSVVSSGRGGRRLQPRRTRMFQGSLQGVSVDFAEGTPGSPPVVFFATLSGEAAQEWHEKKQGYFTYYLVEHLREALPLAQLDDLVRQAVVDATKKRQRPGLRIFEEAPNKDQILELRVAPPVRE